MARSAVDRFSADRAAKCQSRKGFHAAGLGDSSSVSRVNHRYGQSVSHAKVISEINARLGSQGAIRHVDRKYLNNRIESDHAALKQRLRPMRGVQTMTGAKAAIAVIETLYKGQFENCEAGVTNEIAFAVKLLLEAA